MREAVARERSLRADIDEAWPTAACRPICGNALPFRQPHHSTHGGAARERSFASGRPTPFLLLAAQPPPRSDWGRASARRSHRRNAVGLSLRRVPPLWGCPNAACRPICGKALLFRQRPTQPTEPGPQSVSSERVSGDNGPGFVRRSENRVSNLGAGFLARTGADKSVRVPFIGVLRHYRRFGISSEPAMCNDSGHPGQKARDRLFGGRVFDIEQCPDRGHITAIAWIYQGHRFFAVWRI